MMEKHYSGTGSPVNNLRSRAVRGPKEAPNSGEKDAVPTVPSDGRPSCYQGAY